MTLRLGERARPLVAAGLSQIRSLATPDSWVPWVGVTTQTKIRVAKNLYQIARRMRLRGAARDTVVVTRRGLRFELDLREGIDLSIFFLGVFEPLTVRAIRRLAPRGGVALDIGANIGFHTLQLADSLGPTGSVIAFEPTDYAYRKLMRNLELNPHLAQRITPIQAFLDSNAQTGVLPERVYSSWRVDHAATDAHPKHFGSLNALGNAQHFTLDEFVRGAGVSRVDVVKMDVDGFECRVLGGAQSLLNDAQPTFIAELCPYALQEQNASAAEMLGHFERRDYEFYDERHLAPPALSGGDLLRRVPSNSSINFVALKRR